MVNNIFIVSTLIMITAIGAGISMFIFQPDIVISTFFLIIVAYFIILDTYISMLALGIYLLCQNLLVNIFNFVPGIEVFINRADEVIVLTGFVIILWKRILIRKSWDPTPIGIPVVLLVVIAVLSSVMHRLTPFKIAAFDLIILLKGFFIFYIFSCLEIKNTDIHNIIRIFFIAALAIFLLGIIDFLAPAYFRAAIGSGGDIDYRLGIPSVQSIFSHPGIFGWFMAVCATFSVAFFVILNKKQYLFFAILFTFGSMLSMRTKPVIGLSLAMFISFILMPKNRKIAYLFIIMSFVLLFAIFFGQKINLLFKDQMYTYMQSPYMIYSARNILYKTSFRIAYDYLPLGSGLGTFGGWISALYYSPVYSIYGLSSLFGLEENSSFFLMDTFWPYLIGQFGFSGLVIYILILIIFFIFLVKMIYRTDDNFIKAFVLGTILVLAEALPESIASPIFLASSYSYFIFAPIGIIYSVAKRDNVGLRDNH